MRFAYSPLAEVAESLYLIHSGHVRAFHLAWFTAARDAIERFDSPLLRAVVPTRGRLANVFLIGASDTTTTIDDQLQRVVEYPPERFRADLTDAWHGACLPPAAQQLVEEGGGGLARLADALAAYWRAAIEPHWARMRGVLDADVAHRASRMSRGGIADVVSDLHPDVTVDVERTTTGSQLPGGRALSDHGVLLVPSVFVWPWVIVDPGLSGPASVTYGAKGLGTVWEARRSAPIADDSVAALIGRTRAMILSRLDRPRSTTELARQLGQSAPTVSAHLAVLRRCGLVTSSRSGRRVLYRRTSLAILLRDAGRSDAHMVRGSEPASPRAVSGS